MTGTKHRSQLHADVAETVSDPNYEAGYSDGYEAGWEEALDQAGKLFEWERRKGFPIKIYERMLKEAFEKGDEDGA